MATKDQTLFDRLNAQHPIYATMRPHWQRYQDVMSGMINKNQYLFHTHEEPDEIYLFRKQISEFVPECPLAVRAVETAIYGQEPRREIRDDRIDAFMNNADLHGNNLNHVNVLVLRSLLTFGTTRLLINTSRRESGMTVAQERALGVQPYMHAYTPLETPNWAVDALGRLEWIVLRDVYHRQDGPLDERINSTRFTLWSRQEWEEWTFEEDERHRGRARGNVRLVNHQDGRHDLGMVPVICQALHGDDNMIGESFILFSSRIDIRKFRRESDLVYDEYLHSHPTLIVNTLSELAQTGVGANAVIKLDPTQNESAGYLSPPSSAFDSLRASIDTDRAAIRRYAGTDPLGVLEPGTATFQTSGVARAWSFSTSENRILNNIANVMEKVEQAELEIATRWQDDRRDYEIGEQAFEGQVSYPREFDRSATQSLLEETERVVDVINSPSFVKHLHKRYVSRRAEDVPRKEIAAWEKEIEENELLGTRQAREVSLSEEDLSLFGEAPKPRLVQENQQEEGADERSSA